MNVEECLEYILNFDENKLFNTELDDNHTNKKAYREEIRKAKDKFLETKKPQQFNTSEAFNFCGMYLTDTPHQAIAEYMIYALKNIQLHYTEQFLNFVVEQLKEIEVAQ